MIGKQIIGNDISSVLNYNEKKINAGEGEMLSTNMLGEDAKSLSKEFEMIASLKPNVTKSVYHTSLSISPDENLTNEKFQEIGEKYLERMGFGNSQYVIYRHTDQDHPHIHLVANRINLDGSVVSDKWNYKRSEKIIRELEKEYGLQEVQSSDKAINKALSKGQIENFRRTKQIPAKTQLQMLVTKALKNSTSVKDFERQVYKAGANVLFHTNSKGNVFGLSFELDGVKFKASQLGKGYSWNKIKIQLNYERNQGVGHEKGRGTNSDIGSTSRTLAEYEQEKYSRTNGSLISDNERNKTVDSAYKGRDKYDSQSANILSEDSSFSRTKDESTSGHSGRDEKIDSIHESKDLFGVDSSRRVNRSNGLYVPFTGSGDVSDDEEEEIKRRKWKDTDFDQSF